MWTLSSWTIDFRFWVFWKRRL